MQAKKRQKEEEKQVDDVGAGLLQIKKVKGGAGVVLLPRHAVRQAYISMTSVTDTLLCVCVCR